MKAAYLLIFLSIYFHHRLTAQKTPINALLVNDNFEHNLEHWDLYNASKIVVGTVKDRSHHKFVRLIPGGNNIYMLLKNPDVLSNVSIEGDVLFPDSLDSYFGVIYNYKIQGVRNDYGCVYIKGNGNYLWANPHRNDNVSRELYNDFKIPIGRTDSIIIGKWQHFKVEIIDSILHFYVGNMKIPKLVFPYYEYKSGRFGFEPRVNGSEVWLDNVVMKSIKNFTYVGAPIPSIVYPKDNMLVKWQSAGPYVEPQDAIESDFNSLTNTRWNSFKPDGRGCILTGKVTEWANFKRTCYFKYTFNSETEKSAILCISSLNPLVLWCNGIKKEFTAETSAWYDVGINEMHTTQSIALPLKKGLNVLYIRAKSQAPFDGYSGDGFFYRWK